MKSRLTQILAVLILLCTAQISVAQKGFTQYVAKRNLAMEDTTVFVLEVQRAIEKDMVNAWKKAIEKRNKVKSKTTDGQTVIRGVVLAGLGTDTVDIFSTIVQRDTSVVLYAVFKKDGGRIDPNGTEGMSVKVRKLLNQFGTEVYTEVLKREFKEKTDRLKELAQERDANIKKQNDYEKGVQKDSLKIQTAETEIQLLKGQLQSTTDRYVVQKNKLAKIDKDNKDAVKEAKSDLKEIDKERKGIEDDIEDHTEDIIELKAEITDYLYKQTQLKSELFMLEAELEEQRTIVKKADNELRGL